MNENEKGYNVSINHLAGGNYALPALIGYDSPEWYGRGKFEQTITDKAEVIGILQESYEHHRAAILSFSNMNER